MSPPLVTSGPCAPWVVEEVVWEEMAANGGCGWMWEGRVSCVSFVTFGILPLCLCLVLLSGLSDSLVLGGVVWEEVAGVGGCGRKWWVSCFFLSCGIWSFSPLLSSLFCYVYRFCDVFVYFLFLLFCLFGCFWFCCVRLFLCFCLELFLFLVVFLG